MEVLFYICIIIRLGVADFYYMCNRSCSLGYCPVFPCPIFFIRAPERGFLFISWPIICREFISHPIIVINSSSIFTVYVFIYLRFLTMTYVPPIRYAIDGEYRVSAEA